MSTRLFPNVKVHRASPNYSSRRGAHPTLIVIHATAGHNRKGISDLQSLGEWFATGSNAAGNPVSSHVADGQRGLLRPFRLGLRQGVALREIQQRLPRNRTGDSR